MVSSFLRLANCYFKTYPHSQNQVLIFYSTCILISPFNLLLNNHNLGGKKSNMELMSFFEPSLFFLLMA
jgi:hypothetical protein